jgi:hypothetical protein
VCLKPADKAAPFRALLLRKAREFLDTRLDHSDPAAAFFRSRTQAGTAEQLLAEALDEAVPDLTPLGSVRPYEMTVLGVPPGPEGERLVALVREMVPDMEMTTALLPDDICFYREFPQVLLTDLPQLGGAARDAFALMGSDHPAHARTDVTWAQPGT